MALELTVDRRLIRSVRARLEKYELFVGVDDGAHYAPRYPRQIGTLKGGDIRKASTKVSGNVKDVSKAMSDRTDFYRKPFRRKRSADYKKLLAAFVDIWSRKTKSYSRVETAGRALIRNPILRGAYGKANTPVTAKIKGFSRFMFDTGRLFKSIKAKLRARKITR